MGLAFDLLLLSSCHLHIHFFLSEDFHSRKTSTVFSSSFYEFFSPLFSDVGYSAVLVITVLAQRSVEDGGMEMV